MKGENVLGVEVDIMTCGVRKARDSFSQLRRRAASGEEIIIVPDTNEGERGAVSLVPTWFIDDLINKTTDWTVSVLSGPGAPVPEWVSDGKTVYETSGAMCSSSYVLEHQATGITGVGATTDEAVESLIDGLIEYAEEFHNDLPFYLSPRSGRREHYPYVRSIRRHGGNRCRIRAMLTLVWSNG